MLDNITEVFAFEPESRPELTGKILIQKTLSSSRLKTDNNNLTIELLKKVAIATLAIAFIWNIGAPLERHAANTAGIIVLFCALYVGITFNMNKKFSVAENGIIVTEYERKGRYGPREPKSEFFPWKLFSSFSADGKILVLNYSSREFLIGTKDPSGMGYSENKLPHKMLVELGTEIGEYRGIISRYVKETAL